jgi:hypothetical protein
VGVGKFSTGLSQCLQRLHPVEELVGVEILQLPEAKLQRRRLFPHGQMDFDAEPRQDLIEIVPVHKSGVSVGQGLGSKAAVGSAAEITHDENPEWRLRFGPTVSFFRR